MGLNAGFSFEIRFSGLGNLRLFVSDLAMSGKTFNVALRTGTTHF